MVAEHISVVLNFSASSSDVRSTRSQRPQQHPAPQRVRPLRVVPCQVQNKLKVRLMSLGRDWQRKHRNQSYDALVVKIHVNSWDWLQDAQPITTIASTWSNGVTCCVGGPGSIPAVGKTSAIKIFLVVLRSGPRTGFVKSIA